MYDGVIQDLIDELGLREQDIPTAIFRGILVQTVAVIAVSILGGRLSDALGRRKIGEADGNLVAQFHCLTGPVVAAMHNLFAHRFEDRLAAIEDLTFATHHNRERSCDGTRVATIPSGATNAAILLAKASLAGASA